MDKISNSKLSIPSLKMHTPNKVDENIKKIGALFPSAITERKNDEGESEFAIDFDVLKQELSAVVVEGNEERYQFTWPDKKKSVLLANAPIAATLRPCREESVDFDNTENLYIEGDNLDVLKLLQETYLGKVKMIYIDPPYNTGNDFVYADDFAQSTEEYIENSGQYDDEGNRLVKNLDSNGRFHTDWLNMIYPRLRLARDLLSDDGVIFISIDDGEVENLKKVCNEVFGENNFVACLPTIMNLKGNQDEYAFAGTHEYSLVFAKSKLVATFGAFVLDDEEADEWQTDEYGAYKQGANLKSTGINAPREKRPNLYFPLYIKGEEWGLEPFDGANEVYPVTNGSEMSWRWSKQKFYNENYNVIINNNGNGGISVYKKQRPSIGDLPTKKPKTTFYKPEYSSGNGTNEVRTLLGGKAFNFPKPLQLIKDFIQITTSSDDLILDFFSGSATTAHAVMQLNAEDGGKRKFIMVQLPEVCAPESEAAKAGYKNICEIGKERVRRAGAKISSEFGMRNNETASSLPLKSAPPPERSLLDIGNISTIEENFLDIGFRVLKLDSTNMKDVYYSPQEYTQTLFSALSDNIKEDRTPEDLLFQVMLDFGIALSSKIEESVVATKKVFNVAEGFLIACFDEKVSEETVEAIARQKPTYAVFRDSSYTNDSVATNFEQIFTTYSPDTTRKVL